MTATYQNEVIGGVVFVTGRSNRRSIGRIDLATGAYLLPDFPRLIGSFM